MHWPWLRNMLQWLLLDFALAALWAAKEEEEEVEEGGICYECVSRPNCLSLTFSICMEEASC